MFKSLNVNHFTAMDTLLLYLDWINIYPMIEIVNCVRKNTHGASKTDSECKVENVAKAL